MLRFSKINFNFWVHTISFPNFPLVDIAHKKPLSANIENYVNLMRKLGKVIAYDGSQMNHFIH